MNRLEERLRVQLDEAARAVPIPADAWQEHERLLAARRRNRWQPWTAAAAAVLIAAGAGWAVAGGGDRRPVPPAGRTPAPAGSIPDLRDSVVVDRLTLPSGIEVALHLGMADVTEHTTDPELCSMLSFNRDEPKGASYGCHRPVDGAHGQDTVLDYVSVVGSDDPPVTLLGAVDERVAQVEVWTRDGVRQPVSLHPLPKTPWRGFGVISNGGTQTPQRLVAYDASGRVLQADSLDTADSSDGPTAACSGPALSRFRTQVTDNGVPVEITVGLWEESTAIDLGGPNQCADLTDELSTGSWLRIGNIAVVVVAPEVDRVRLVVDGQIWQAEAGPIPSSPWKVAVLTDTPEADGELEMLDSTGQVIETIFAAGYRIH